MRIKAYVTRTVDNYIETDFKETSILSVTKSWSAPGNVATKLLLSK